MSYATRTDAVRDPRDEYSSDDDDVRGNELGGRISSLPVTPLFESVSDRYKMNHSQRGKALIFNNKKFDSKIKLDTRWGTDIDADNMYSLFKTLGFEDIVKIDDLSADEMKAYMISASEDDYTDKDCFACAILSHGDEGCVCCYDGTVTIEDLVAPFRGDKCKDLAGKPKLFFIQACRGTKEDPGANSFVGEGDSEEEAEGESKAENEVRVLRIPAGADFLMAYSTTPGFSSTRNPNKGSWFIQAISYVFNKQWKDTDVLAMMTNVNRMMAYDFGPDASSLEKNGNKQIACITSMLTKKIFFFNN